MSCRTLAGAIDVYEIGSRVLYAKTGDRNFAMFEDELTPEELQAIAQDIARRGADAGASGAGRSLAATKG